MSHHHHLVAVIAALLPLSGCELFSVETEIPELCVGFKDRLMPAVQGMQDFERRVLADPLKSFGAYLALDAEITSASATLRAKSGVSDLSFIDSLSVSIRSTENGGYSAPLSLLSCEDYACASDTLESSISTVPPEGLMDVIQLGQVELEVRLTGDLPEVDWVVDIELCVSGKARAALEL